MRYLIDFLYGEGLSIRDVKNAFSKNRHSYFARSEQASYVLLLTSSLPRAEIEIISREEFQQRKTHFQDEVLIGISKNHKTAEELLLVLTNRTIEEGIPGEFKRYAMKYSTEELG